MEHFVNHNFTTHKNNITVFDNAADNQKALRIFRDMSTDIYVKVFFNDNDQIANFLDYTFHMIYSKLIINTNKTIIEYNINNSNIHIKPISGPERCYLVFKGGTLMNRLFADHLDKMGNNTNTSSVHIGNHYGVPLANFFTDLETNTQIPNTVDTFSNFCDNILKKKFSISDTDYSLYIYSQTNERFDILHNFALINLAHAFDDITDKFDNYLNDVSNMNSSYNQPNSIVDLVDDTTDSEIYVQISLLQRLRDFIYDDNNIVYLKNLNFNDPINNPAFNTLNDGIIEFINNVSINDTKLFYLYDVLEILNLLIYIESLGNFIFRLNRDIVSIRNNIESRINDLINKKLSNLKNGLFYSYNKIQLFKQTLFDQYLHIQNTQNTTSSNYYGDKIETFFKPEKCPSIEKTTYRLNNNNQYNINSFEIKQRNSCSVMATSNSLQNSKIYDIPIQKTHYITFNTLIKKTRNKSHITDFDLMRSKFNVVLPNGFVKKNNIDHNLNIPSEFIDVSIPRYFDNSRIEYFHNLTNNGFIPHLLKLTTPRGRSIVIFSYSPQEVSHDLQIVLFNQNTLEPWVDLKYAKRLIRLVVFMVITSYVDKIRFNKNMDDIVNICNFCNKLYLHFNNANTQYPYDVAASFILTKNNNVNTQNDISNYLAIAHQQIVPWMTNNLDLPILNFSNRYTDCNMLLKHIFTWSMILNSGDNDLHNITEIISSNFLQQNQNTLGNISEIRNKFKKLINIIFDYGFKMHYIYNNILIGGGNKQRFKLKKIF